MRTPQYNALFGRAEQRVGRGNVTAGALHAQHAMEQTTKAARGLRGRPAVGTRKAGAAKKAGAARKRA